MRVDGFGLSVDSAKLWSENAMGMLEKAIKVFFQTNIIVGFDAGFRASFFDAEDREPVCWKFCGADFVESVVQSALDNADDTLCIVKSGVNDEDVKSVFFRFPAASQEARENTRLKLSKALIGQNRGVGR